MFFHNIIHLSTVNTKNLIKSQRIVAKLRTIVLLCTYNIDAGFGIMLDLSKKG